MPGLPGVPALLGVAEHLGGDRPDAARSRAHHALVGLVGERGNHDRHVGATIFHVMRGEVSSAVTTFILMVLATIVAYMRWRVTPIAPRMPAMRSRVV